MRQLTLKEVQEQYGGKLPPDAVLCEDAKVSPSPFLASNPKRTRSERFAELNAFVDLGMMNLTCSEVKVWLVLFRDTKKNGTARTGQADIARRAGLSERGVRKALDKLEAKGMLKLVRRGRLNQGPSCYCVRSVELASGTPVPVA